MNSLIDCPDCGQKVSPRAAACPACAAPIGAQRATDVRRGVQRAGLRRDLGNGIGFLSIVVALAAGMLFGFWPAAVILVGGTVVGLTIAYT
jgi:hypothetical protein